MARVNRAVNELALALEVNRLTTCALAGNMADVERVKPQAYYRLLSALDANKSLQRIVLGRVPNLPQLLAVLSTHPTLTSFHLIADIDACQMYLPPPLIARHERVAPPRLGRRSHRPPPPQYDFPSFSSHAVSSFCPMLGWLTSYLRSAIVRQTLKELWVAPFGDKWCPGSMEVDAFLEALGQCATLDSVHLIQIPFLRTCPAQLGKALATLPRLTHLGIRGSVPDLTCLAPLTKLSSLGYGLPSTGTMHTPIVRFADSLTVLEVDFFEEDFPTQLVNLSSFTGDFPTHLLKLTNLSSFTCYAGTISDMTLFRALRTLPALEHFALHPGTVSDELLKHLGTFICNNRVLRRLTLDISVGPIMINALCNNTRLENLTILAAVPTEFADKLANALTKHPTLRTFECTLFPYHVYPTPWSFIDLLNRNRRFFEITLLATQDDVTKNIAFRQALIRAIRANPNVCSIHNSDLPADVRRALNANAARRRSWMQVAPFIAFLRANYLHTFRTSIIPLLNTIGQVAGFTPPLSPTKLSLFLSSKFLTNQIIHSSSSSSSSSSSAPTFKRKRS